MTSRNPAESVSISGMGRITGIYVAAEKTELPHSVAEVEALTGQGLAGDRYANGVGTFSEDGDPKNEVTLIESEALEALKREYDIDLSAEASRRNLRTEGVALNHLVGRRFSIGQVELEGVKLCEPCGHLQSLTAAGVEKGLRHRGGLRSRIRTGGVIRVGDAVVSGPNRSSQ